MIIMAAEPEIVAKEKQQAEGAEKTRPGRYFVPDVDIAESDKGLVLWADMPGVSEKDVEVNLENQVLRITGTIDTSSYDKLSPLYTEYNVGNYHREFRLHEDIDRDGITAHMRNGVLEVQLPKRAQAQPRRIEIKPT
jgi:HSP20 family molecular chaperone IbpA